MFFSRVHRDVSVRKAEAWVFTNEWNQSYKYEHVDPSSDADPTTGRVVPRYSVAIVTGSSAAARTLDRALYLSMSKLYYARLHPSYSFHHVVSTKYVEYFPMDLFSRLHGSAPHTGYFRGISKYRASTSVY